MELPDEYTSFWSAQVDPGTVCKITVPEDVDCVLSNAALSQEATRPEIGKSRLFAKVNGQMETVIISFTINSFESSMLDIQFGENDVIEFTVEGECPIHIAGYITGALPLDIENPVGGPVLSSDGLHLPLVSNDDSFSHEKSSDHEQQQQQHNEIKLTEEQHPEISLGHNQEQPSSTETKEMPAPYLNE